MRNYFVICYKLPKTSGTYKCRLRSFKRRGIKFCIWYIYAKIKYTNVEVTKF